MMSVSGWMDERVWEEEGEDTQDIAGHIPTYTGQGARPFITPGGRVGTERNNHEHEHGQINSCARLTHKPLTSHTTFCLLTTSQAEHR